jgi:hypothetical protein
VKKYNVPQKISSPTILNAKCIAWKEQDGLAKKLSLVQKLYNSNMRGVI